MNYWWKTFYKYTFAVFEYLHTLVVLNNYSCLVVFGQPFMTISVMFKQLFTFSLCSNSLLFLAVFKLLFLLSHVWMMMLVVFEQLIIFSCVWTAFLLSHVWMTLLVVFEQLIIFSYVWSAFFIESDLNDDVSCVWTTNYF